MSEDQSFDLPEILGVAVAGIRGAAFSDMADELNERTSAIVEAYKALHEALDVATKSPDYGKGVTDEDRAVVAASKAYALAELGYLTLLQGYLEFVVPYSLGSITGAASTGGVSGLKGLIPGA